MKKYIMQFANGFLMIPFMALGTPFTMITDEKVIVNEVINSSQVVLFEERARKIDAYFLKRKMPLAGYGIKMVHESNDNGLDWRLLPAIAIRESTGGKFACHNNPFGWGSCSIKFKNFDEAIKTVAAHLGGNKTSTTQYYKNKTTIEKLSRYNSVIPSYTKEIFEFMQLIENNR